MNISGRMQEFRESFKEFAHSEGSGRRAETRHDVERSTGMTLDYDTAPMNFLFDTWNSSTGGAWKVADSQGRVVRETYNSNWLDYGYGMFNGSQMTIDPEGRQIVTAVEGVTDEHRWRFKKLAEADRALCCGAALATSPPLSVLYGIPVRAMGSSPLDARRLRPTVLAAFEKDVRDVDFGPDGTLAEAVGNEIIKITDEPKKGLGGLLGRTKKELSPWLTFEDMPEKIEYLSDGTLAVATRTNHGSIYEEYRYFLVEPGGSTAKEIPLKEAFPDIYEALTTMPIDIEKTMTSLHDMEDGDIKNSDVEIYPDCMIIEGVRLDRQEES